MAWNHATSKKRVETHLENMPEITVQKLERDADLESLLSEGTCREIFGAHVYMEIANFSALNAATDDESTRALLRAIHIYQRQVAWIVETLCDGVRVHFQASRIHVLFYRPIDDDETLAAKATLVMMIVRDFLRFVFNPLFTDYPNLTVRGGADLGVVIGTQNGAKGERELLFLGDPANHAAKIITDGLRLTAALYDALPADLQAFCAEAEKEEGIYWINTIGNDDLVRFASEYDISWSRDDAKERVEADIDAMPLEDFELSAAEVLIDFETLSYRNNKGVLAASVFADVSGFTKFIEAADTDEKKEHAIKVLHIIRAELTRVVTQDFEGAVRIQNQGDRTQALIHLPEANRTRIAQKAVDIAIAAQSSLELVIKPALDGIATLGLAVGVSIGDVIATRLGPRGHRDRIVLGASVLDAAANEERTSKGAIGISKSVYDELEEDMQERFTYEPSAKCYVAYSLTNAVLERQRSLATAVYAGAAAPVVITSTDRGITVTREEVGRGGTKVIPSKSYGE